jgi:hypothetical protein
VLGVVCALIGWWAIEKQAGRQSKQQLPLATTTKPKRIS